MKFTFFLRVLDDESSLDTEKSIADAFESSKDSYDIVKVTKENDVHELIINSDSDYILFWENGCLFTSKWTNCELTKDIYKLVRNANGKNNVLLDNMSKSIENYCTYVIKRSSALRITLVMSGIYWQIKELVLKLICGKITIDVLADVSGEYASFGVIKKEYNNNVDELFEFLDKVICPYAEYSKISGSYMWVQDLLLSYYDECERYTYKMVNERAKYCRDLIVRLVKNIDESIFINRKDLKAVEKIYWLRKINSENLRRVIENDSIFYFYKEKLIIREGFSPLSIVFTNIEEEYVELEGYAIFVEENERPQVLVYANGQEYLTEALDYNLDQTCAEEVVIKRTGFKVRIKLESNEDYTISFALRFKEITVPVGVLQFNKYAPIYGGSNGIYYEKNGWIMKSDSKIGEIYFIKSTPAQRKQCRKIHEKELMKSGIKKGVKQILVYRYANFMKKHFKKKIWLISDRTNRTDDNGECFFKYLSKHKNELKDIKMYFVLDKHCEAAKDMKKYGKLVQPMSFRHKMLHLRSEYVVSSQANDPVINPFLKMQKMYRPLLRDMKFVFLQHGVIKDDLSGWLNRYNRDMYGFVVSTKPEYDSILEYDYRYTSKEVWLTGLPRYDFLYHDEKKYITIMPTWRKTLMAGTDSTTGLWLKGDNFDDSSFVKFYNRLLNDEDLIGYCKERGYTLCFMPHPIIAPYVEESFNHHPDVKFVDADMKYRNVFAESDLILTDYSSVAFDFAYLRKPILYAQFDREEFFGGGHSYVEGYFDYEKDGFGKVCTTYEDTVSEIKKAVDNKCVLEDEYRKRIDKTFAFDDKNCSARILEKMLAKK